jgi:hypothetical protein
MNGQASREKGKNTTRNVFPGFSSLMQAGKGIYSTNESKISNEEEKNIFENGLEIKQIIENLERKEDK